MKLLLFIFGIFILNVSIVLGQSTLIVRVVDSLTQRQEENCTIKLITALGEKSLKSNERISLSNGNYIIDVSHVAYEKKKFSFHLLKDTTLNILLIPKSLKMEEVSVNAERSMAIKKGNIILFPTKIFESQTTWDIIKNSGYVEATEGGDLSIRQKRSTVYINNRKLYFSGEELKNYLESIPGNIIKRIEVVPNPDVSHSSDELTVVRIITKESEFVGYRVNVISSLSRSMSTSNNQSVKTDYSNKNYDMQWFIARNVLAKKNWSSYTYDFGKKTLGIDQNTETSSETLNTFFLFNYYPNLRNNFTLYLNYMGASDRSNINANDKYSSGPSDSVFNRINKIGGNSNNLSFNSNYTLKNDSGNRVLKLQFDILKNMHKNDNNLHRDFYLIGHSDLRSERIKRDVIHTILKANYTLNTKKIGSWLAGIEYSYNQTRNPINISQTNEEIFSETYKYNEVVYAPYAQGSWELENTYIRASLRQEFHLGNVADSQIYKINGLFPSVLVQHKIDDKILELSYKKSLKKPPFSLLNNVSIASDNSVVSTSGNINILPEITHNIEASLYKGAFQFSAGTTYYKNYISTLITESEGVLTQRYNNFGLTLPYTFIGYIKKINKVWTLKNYLNAMIPLANFKEIESAGSTLSLNNRFTNTITMKNDISAEISFSYSKRYSDGYFVHHSSNDLSITVQKKITKLNLLIYVTAKDIFKGTNNNIHSLYENINYKANGYGDLRNIKLGIYYSFGNQKLKIKEKEKSNLDELNERLK